MASTTTVSLGDLIEAALSVLYRPIERPAEVTLGSNALDSLDDVQLTLAAGDDVDVSPPCLLQAGQELMLVTAKSADATPVFTVSRGYAGTPKATAATGTVLQVDPQWSRHQVRNAVLRAFRRPLNAFLPSLKTEQLDPAVGKSFIEIPTTAIEVLRVFYVDPQTGKGYDLDGWDFYDDVAGASSTGKLLSLHGGISMLTQVGSNLYVTYQRPYTWSAGGDNPAEDATIDIPLGAEDLPALYAAAYLLSNREVTRAEIDRSEEWPQEQAVRQGVSLRMVRQAWEEFYRGLDEARRLQNVPRRIRYRKRRMI